MDFIASIPIWLLAIVIFSMRIIDVSIGTLRTLTVVSGMVKISVLLGFLESFVWLIAVSQVVSRMSESPILPFVYAGGFAAGSGVGILLEKRFGFGEAVLRIISLKAGDKIAKALRENGQRLTTFTGEGRDGPVTMIYISCPKKKLKGILSIARELDSELYFVAERANDWRHTPRSDAFFTGWRGVMRGK